MKTSLRNRKEHTEAEAILWEQVRDKKLGVKFRRQHPVDGFIADFAEPAEYIQIVERTRTIYDHMKDAHPFLTSREDISFAALLALSGLNTGQVEREMEQAYQILRTYFVHANAVQSLSHIVALGDGSTKQICRKITDLYDYLKKNGYKFGGYYELAALGVLALIDTDMKAMAVDIMETDDFLKTQKGFGILGIGAKQRLMYAGMLVSCDHIPLAGTMHMAVQSGIVSLVTAQQIAVYAAIAASSSASSSASS